LIFDLWLKILRERLFLFDQQSMQMDDQ